MTGRSPREDDERKHSYESSTSNARETLPEPSMAMNADVNDSTNKQFSNTEEVSAGAVGEHKVTEKVDNLRDQDVCDSNMDGGGNAAVITNENNALKLETDEWISIIEGAEVHEFVVIGKYNGAEENSEKFDRKTKAMWESSKNNSCDGFFRKKKSSLSMCRSTTECEVYGRKKDGHTEDVKEAKGHKIETNTTVAPTNHKKQFLAKKGQHDNTYISTVELDTSRAITDEDEEKDWEYRSMEVVVQMACTDNTVCKTEFMHQNQYCDSKKHIEHCCEENNGNTNVNSKENTKLALTENEIKGTSVILEEYHSLKVNETQSSLSNNLTVETNVRREAEKGELSLVWEDNVRNEAKFTGRSLDQTLEELPSSNNSVQMEKLATTAFLIPDNREKNEAQLSLSSSSTLNVEKVTEDRIENLGLLVVEKNNVAGETSKVHPVKDEYFLPNLLQRQANMILLEADISSKPSLSHQNRVWEQPCNISFQNANECKQSDACMQYEAEENKEMIVSESYQVMCSSETNKLGQQNRSYAPIQYKADDTKEMTIRYQGICGSETKNLGQQSDFSSEYSKKLIEINTKDQYVTEEEEISATESEPENCIVFEFNVKESSEINFECPKVNSLCLNFPIDKKGEACLDMKDPLLNQRAIDGTKDITCMAESYLHRRKEIAFLRGIISSEDLNEEFLMPETASEVENKVSIDKKEEAHATTEKHKDGSDAKPEDKRSYSYETIEEKILEKVEHHSAQDLTLLRDKTKYGRQISLQKLPASESNKETPSMELSKAELVNKYALKVPVKTEDSITIIDRGITNSSPSQNMTCAKIPSVSENSNIDVAQEKTCTADFIHFNECGFDEAQSRILPEGDTGPQSNTKIATLDIPCIEEINEELDKNKVSLKEKSNAELPSTLERTRTKRLKAPLLSFFKNEVNIVPSQQKGDITSKNASDKTDMSLYEKFMATPSRRHEKHKNRSSFISTCMCCTKDI